MNYSLHPQAAQDLGEILGFYERTATPRVATGFLAEFERVARLLVANPGFGTPFDLPRRIYPLRTYPYSVVYRPTDDELRVLTVRHQSRLPSYGAGRT